MRRNDTWEITATIKVRDKNGSTITHKETMLAMGNVKKAMAKAKNDMVKKYASGDGLSCNGVQLKTVWCGLM